MSTPGMAYSARRTSKEKPLGYLVRYRAAGNCAAGGIELTLGQWQTGVEHSGPTAATRNCAPM
jgi:hypothetical protein